jgi:ribose transport system ATP-binding protein
MSPLVTLDGIGKRFGATEALRDVDLRLMPGEVHVLAGQNGAGKSTLLKILSGVHQPDSGTLRVAGDARVFAGPADAARAGIATIHQELSLVGSTSVCDNLLLAERGRPWDWLRPARRRQRARAMLDRLELDVDPDQPVEALPLATRQLLEIVRALASGAQVVVMDEPTSALGQRDAERLFEQIEQLRDRGAAVLYISHRMEELARLADHITVLRDGRVVASEPAERMPPDELVRHMVGKELNQLDAARVPAPARADDDVVLRAKGITCRTAGASLRGVDLSIRRGEVVGVAGLLGSGASIVARALFGALPITGALEVAGTPVAHPSPRASLRRGVMWIGGDRAATLIAGADLVDNITLPSLERFSFGPWLLDRRAASEAALAHVNVKHAGMHAPLEQLSGGNQQKVAIARALIAEPQLLLLDEPTRGIDIGAKRDVHRALMQRADAGCALMVVSTDLDELVALCHRVLVLVDGEIAAVVDGPELSRAAILGVAMGALA